MKVQKFKSVLAGLLLASIQLGPAFAMDRALGRLDTSASSAFAAGDYKRAEATLLKLQERLNLAVSRNGESRELQQVGESTFRHLGECAMAQKNYDAADDYFKQARTIAQFLQLEDADLDKDAQDLSRNYRVIDLNNLGNLGIIGPIVTAALSEFHPNKVSVSKLDSGHHVSVLLNDDIVKDIGAKGVTQVGVSKNMSFDLSQGEGGTITLSNITGIKVRAGFWVNIINSSLKLDESQHPMAQVTAQKMGISQSVATSVPDMIYLPVVAIVNQVKNLFPGDSVQPGNFAQPDGGSSQMPGGIYPGAYAATPPAQNASGYNQPQTSAAVTGNLSNPGTQAQIKYGATPTPPSPAQPPVPPYVPPSMAPVTNTTDDTTTPVMPIPPANGESNR